MQAAVTAAEMRAAEDEAASRGLTSTALMQLAGRAIAEYLLADSQATDRRYLILVGPGNNGGDALVVAALLVEAGAEVRCAQYRRSAAGPTQRPDPPGITHLTSSMRFDCGTAEGLETLCQSLLWADIVVDGVLGTGLSRPPEGDLKALLIALQSRASRVRLVAIDVPTGVDPDSGAADSLAVTAAVTLTLGYMKRGLLVHPGRDHCGDLQLLDIGLPRLPRTTVSTRVPEAVDIARILPKRSPSTQKYSAGAVLVLAGSPQYLGAPVLTCSAASRTGAGYVSLAVQQQSEALIGPRLLETTLIRLDRSNPYSTIFDRSARYHALVVGPGLGRDARAKTLVRRVLAGDLPGIQGAVVDADALYALAEMPDWFSSLRMPMVLTPHTGEMARLTGLTSDYIEAHRFAVAEQYARAWHQVVVLKGAPTVIASPDGTLLCNPTGNPLLATAGTGDVLSGCIGALLAGGASMGDCACGGVYLHGLAADLALREYGDRGMVAGDLLNFLPKAIAAVKGLQP